KLTTNSNQTTKHHRPTAWSIRQARFHHFNILCSSVFPVSTPAARARRTPSLKSDTSVESESDSVVSVIYRSKASASGGAGNGGGGGLSDNSIDSEESIVSVIHRSTEETPRAGSANGNGGANRSWQASPLTISQAGSREGSFSSPEYSPTLKTAPLKTEKVSCKLWETSLAEVDDEHVSDARSTSPQLVRNRASRRAFGATHSWQTTRTIYVCVCVCVCVCINGKLRRLNIHCGAGFGSRRYLGRGVRGETNLLSSSSCTSLQPSGATSAKSPATSELTQASVDDEDECNTMVKGAEKNEDGEGSADAASVAEDEEEAQENKSSPQLTPSSSSDDAPYMSDEEVQCEDIPESFELKSTEPPTVPTTPVDLTRLQPPPSRRICSPVDPLELEDDVLESIPEEDESCSPIKSPRSKQGDDTHFPMPTPELSRQQQKSQSANKPATPMALTLDTPTSTAAASSSPARATPSPSVTKVTPSLRIVTTDVTSAPLAVSCEEHPPPRQDRSASSRSSAPAPPGESRTRQQQQQQLPVASVAGGDGREKSMGARLSEQQTSDRSPASGAPASPSFQKLADAERGVTLHSNVPEQKSSANSPCASSNCCANVGGAATGGSPLWTFRGLPSRLQQSDCIRRASDVGPQSKCPKDRAKFSPQYSLPEHKKFQKELTASCEQLFKRRPSPQRQQEIRSDLLNELLRGPTKTAAIKPTLSEAALVGLQHQQRDDAWGRTSMTSTSPEPAGPSSARRRTSELRTSPLEILAQELRSSTDDLYRRAATDLCQLSIDTSHIERRSSPERRRTPDYLRTSPDPRFEDAAEDAGKSVTVGTDFNYWDDWLPQALSRIYAAKTNYDCDELCDQLSDQLPDFVPQTTRYIGGRISADGDILYSDRDSPEDICLGQEHLFLACGFQGAQNLQSVSAYTPPTLPEQFSDADESTASTTDQEISDLSSSLERLRVSCGLQPEITSAQPLNLNIVIEDFSDQGGSDAEISEACSSNAASSNANQLYVQERQGGSSSLSDHSDRSSASVQTVFKLDTSSKEASPEVPLELQTSEVDVPMDPITDGDDADAQQEKLSLTSSSSEDSSDENFGDSCCGNMTGHSAETYHRYYHVFRQGELDSLIEKYVHSLHILKSYYDHSSWCIVAERVQVWTI
ncbi:hypothetical protein BIW11_10861, partial [Tropilaelaps mercedesae]